MNFKFWGRIESALENNIKQFAEIFDIRLIKLQLIKGTI